MTDEPEDAAADAPGLDVDEFYDVLEDVGSPVVTAGRAAAALGWSQADASDALDALAERGQVRRREVDADPVVWYPADWAAVVDRERVVVFPGRREVVVDDASQFTRARLSGFARLADANRDGGYIYEIQREDVWHAPHDSLDDLLGSVRGVLPERYPDLEEWIERQWRRAREFRLTTHPDGYTVLETDSESLMGNVARPKLDDGELRAPISETESWVAEDGVASVKRVLYEAGYPVRDDRDLDEGDDLALDLRTDLRDYQRDWVDRFLDAQSGVLVGPPGSGKTVAALGVLAAVGGETLILVPGRDLVSQWRDAILEHTTLGPDDVGEYHGGVKDVRPVTVATYQIAGADRHRALFDRRRWGVIVYDEVHHIPADVHRRTADLQGKHRLGLSATPVRGDDRESDIYALVGSPIGTDWDALFDAGFVQEPEVAIRYVGWESEMAQSEYAAADGHERRLLAASNPAKVAEVRRLLDEYDDRKALIFVDYLDQGREIADALDLAFVSGETRHVERERLLASFRDGRRDALVISRVGDEGIDLPDAELAVIASGLGGSRRQGAQRAGRTMRPTGRALTFVLATRDTREETFARRQFRYLGEKGVRVREEQAGDGDVDAA